MKTPKVLFWPFAAKVPRYARRCLSLDSSLASLGPRYAERRPPLRACATCYVAFLCKYYGDFYTRALQSLEHHQSMIYIAK
jgi:hypothetical protein